MAKKRGKNSTAKQKINSRDKGRRGEYFLRDLINWELTSWSYDPVAERGQQRSGSPDSPDVKSPLPAQWEMKFGYVSRPEWPDLEEVMAKLRTETDLDQDVPVIVWKRAAPGRRNVPPLAIMRAEDAIRLLTMKRWLDEQYPSDKLPPFRLDSE